MGMDGGYGLEVLERKQPLKVSLADPIKPVRINLRRAVLLSPQPPHHGTKPNAQPPRNLVLSIMMTVMILHVMVLH